MWSKLTTWWYNTWLYNIWCRFEAWLASIAPGQKTKIIQFLGLLGNGAVALQGYVSGLPLDKIITSENIIILNVVLFTLGYWFKDIYQRVEDRADA